MGKLVYKGKSAVITCPRGTILINEKSSQKDLKYVLARGIKLEGAITEIVKEVKEVIEIEEENK